jgi:hypothetical protein
MQHFEVRLNGRYPLGFHYHDHYSCPWSSSSSMGCLYGIVTEDGIRRYMFTITSHVRL